VINATVSEMADTEWLGSLMPNGIYTIIMRIFDDFDKKILSVDLQLEYYNHERAVVQEQF
jgi:hypothetical protein